MGSVPSLGSRASSSSSDEDSAASGTELSEFTLTGSVTTATTAELSSVKSEYLEDEIVSYQNEDESECNSLVILVGTEEYVETSCYVAEKKAQEAADEANIWMAGIRQMFEQQPDEPPREIFLSNVNQQIAVAGSLEILKDPEIWICDTGASNHSTFSKLGCSIERPSNISSQGITGAALKAECEVDLPRLCVIGMVMNLLISI